MIDLQLRDLRRIHEISGMDGTWNYNDYNQGLYNGLEMALAIVEDRDPVFRQSPEVWLQDLPDTPVDLVKLNN